jgi:hypothetical protein
VTTATPCEECRAIAKELRNAFAEMPPQLRDDFRADCDAFRRLIGETEEDAERVEGMVGGFGQSGWFELPEGRYPAIQNAFRRMVMNRFRTGHWVRFDT